MDTNKMRDQFEAWAIKDAASTGRSLKFERGGEWYLGKDHQQMNLGWAAWQASREAVVVELPEPDLPEVYADEPVDRESEEFRYLEARHGAQCQTYRKCRQAIEAHGLRVAP